MTAIITFVFTFLAFLVMSIGLGFIAVISAFLVGKAVPRTHDICAKCISGWSSKRGLRNRLVLAPLLITLIIFVALAVVGLTDTSRVRSRLQESTHIVVRSGGNCHRRPEQERVLLRVEEPDEIRALSERISIGLSMPGMHCRCCGDMTFDCYRDEELHYSFSFHHGKSIRIEEADSGDKGLTLASRRSLSEWLERTGVTKAIEQAIELEEQKRKAEQEGERDVSVL
jgi:hypothetical protein